MKNRTWEFRLVFLVVFGVWFALTAAQAGLLLLRPRSGGPFPEWRDTYNFVSTLTTAVTVAGMIILLIGLYRHLLQPRAAPVRPLMGLLVALVGVLLMLTRLGLLAGIGGFVYDLSTAGFVYDLSTAVSFFVFPLFLFGLGLMFLWGSPPEPVPLFFPQPVPPQTVPPAREVTSGPRGLP